MQLSGKAAEMVQGVLKQTYEGAEQCLKTNYYGAKKVTEALLPLLQLSTSGARIVNISTLRGELKVHQPSHIEFAGSMSDRISLNAEDTKRVHLK